MTAIERAPQHAPSRVDEIVGAIRMWRIDHLIEDLEGALAAATESLREAEANDWSLAIAHAQLVMGGAHGFMGHFEQAELLLQSALDRFTALDDRWGIACCTIRMNLVWFSRGHHQHSIDQLTALLPETRGMDDPFLHFFALNDIGRAWGKLGSFDRSIAYALQAHAIAERNGHPFCRLVSRINLGGLYLQHLDLKSADDLLREGLAIIKHHPEHERMAMYFEYNLGSCAHQRGELDEAAEWYEHAIVHARRYRVGPLLVETLYHTGCVYLALGQSDRADAQFMELLAESSEGDPAFRVLARWHHESLAATWSWDTVTHLRTILDTPNAPPSKERIAIANALAESTAHLGDMAAANAHLRDALHEQETWWRTVTTHQSHMAMQLLQTREAQQQADRARQENEAITRAMQEIVGLNARNEALVGQLQAQSATLDRLAREDSLTGVANRRAFDEHLQAELIRARSFRHPLAVGMLDIDNFKQINDRYSHITGDLVLKTVATILRRMCRETDIVARFGGDEFGIILVEIDPSVVLPGSNRAMDDIRAYPWDTIAPGLQVTLSAGMRPFTAAELDDALTAASLITEVDALLYRAKRAGKNRVIGPPPISDRDPAEPTTEDVVHMPGPPSNYPSGS